MWDANDPPPPKPTRRKKPEVLVHNNAAKQEERSPSPVTIKRTYSANFDGQRHHHDNKARHHHGTRSKHTHREIEEISHKISRRFLSRENSRLAKENDDLVGKFNELEELSVKRIVKLREKISALQSWNEEMGNENRLVKEQVRELESVVENLRVELEVARKCHRCVELGKALEKVERSNEGLVRDKEDLEGDLNMLKTVVFRLNQQMERYQDKVRQGNIKTSPHLSAITDNHQVIDKDPAFLTEIHGDHTHTPISWGKVNNHTLGPLLDAYQDTITEKDEIIANYENELSNFGGKLKIIMEENERLRRSLDEDEESSARLKIEVSKQTSELKSVKEQNDILIKKCSVKQDKLDEIIKLYEIKVDQLKRDYQVVHDQYCKARGEITGLREKNRALVEAQDEFKNERQGYIPLSVHNASVDECKKLYEELKRQYDQERSKLKDQVEELKDKIGGHVKEKEALEAKIRQLDKQIKKSDSKVLEIEHTLAEAQFARSALKKQLHKAMNFAKDLVAEQETLLQALNQRQMENKAVKKIGSDMASRMDSLKNELKIVQRDAWQELTTVEKRIAEQKDAMESLKQEHDQEIERLQDIIKRQQHEPTNLILKEQSPVRSQYVIFRDKHK